MFEELRQSKITIRKLQQELYYLQEEPYRNRLTLAKYLGMSETSMRDLADEHPLFRGECGYGAGKVCGRNHMYHPYRVRLIEAVHHKLLTLDKAWELWNDFLGEMRASLKFDRTATIVPQPMKRGRKPKERDEVAA